MLELLLFMCVALVGLIFLSFTLSKKYTIKMILGFIIMSISMYMIPAFYKLQVENGNPDVGQEFGQLYLPIIIFIICALLGIIISIKALIKSKRKE